MLDSKVYFEIKPEWDVFSHIDDKTSTDLKIKRDVEIEFVKDFINNKTEGGLLLSGKSGSGKSTLVHQAINEIEPKQGRTILYVEMNATMLENRNMTSDDHNDSFLSLKRAMLQNLILKLSDTIWRKINDHGNLIEVKDELADLEGLARSESHKSFQEMKVPLEKLPSRKNPVSYNRKDFLKTYHEERVYDNLDLTLMQNYLESFLRLMDDLGYLVCFIIDEVDKIDEVPPQFLQSDELESNPYENLDLLKSKSPCVMDVAKSLKTLINTHNALFIFVTSDIFYDVVDNYDLTKNSSSHTLFAERLYLQRPTYKEISLFLDNIIIDPPEKGKQKSSERYENYETFKNYLSYRSRNSFYDVYYYLRDFITYKEKESARLLLDLSDGQRSIAKLQKILYSIYDDKKYTRISNFSKNSKLREKLYQFMGLLIDLQSGETFSTSEDDEHLEIIATNNVRIKSNDEKPSDDTQQVSLKDFIYELERGGFLKRISKSEDVFEVMSRLPNNITEIEYKGEKTRRRLQNEVEILIKKMNVHVKKYNKSGKKSKLRVVDKRKLSFKDDLRKVVSTIKSANDVNKTLQNLYPCFDHDIKRRYSMRKLGEFLDTVNGLQKML